VRADVRFRDARHLRQVIERIAIRAGRRVDEASPLLDARLPDGSRANVVLTPIARFGDALTIRKFPRGGLTVADLVARGTVSAHVAAFLEAAVRGRLNLVVSGGTSSGKTTTLNALSAFIPEGERIVTIEDAAELRLQQAHVVSLEARPPNAEGAGEITIRQLVRNALRMRPDRIVVGEVRGGEALDMLQAMNTGHEGSLTTAHANSPRDLVLRLETMVLMAGVDLPLLAVRQQIASALHLIVHQERMGDGVRRITSVMEVTGLEEGVVAMQPIYTFVQEGAARAGDPIAGRWQWSGVRPRCEARLRQLGIDFRFEDDPGAPALGRRGGEEALW
jgi:pilus assembly protein CpaF